MLPMRYVGARDLVKFLDECHPSALVAWDRDIEPLLCQHDAVWGADGDFFGDGPLWISLSVRGEATCCHFKFDEIEVRWVARPLGAYRKPCEESAPRCAGDSRTNT